MKVELHQFLLRRGQIGIDDLLGTCLVGWIAGIGATLLGSLVIAFLKAVQAGLDGVFAVFLAPVFFSIFLVPIGICVALPFIWLVQMIGILNGFIVILIGISCASPIALIFATSGDLLAPYALLVVLVGCSAAAGAWYAGAFYSNDAV